MFSLASLELYTALLDMKELTFTRSASAAGASASLPETTAMAQKKKKMKLAPTQTGAAGSSGCAVEPARKLQVPFACASLCLCFAAVQLLHP